jgi:hypothetical protein
MGRAPGSAELTHVNRALPRLADLAGFGLLILVTAGVLAATGGHEATIAAGTPPLASCSDRAAVSYSTTYSAKLPGYVVTSVPIRSGPACAHDRYEVIVSDARHRVVSRGLLDARGAARAAIGDEQIDAATVSVAVVITG